MHKAIKNLEIPEAQKQLIERYLALLIKWNGAYNLTAIKNYNDMVVKHVLDSLSIKDYVNGDFILDVGTGAGLPGLILAIIFPDKQFTLLDSNGKKIRFLIQAIHELKLENCEAIQSRVEEYQSTELFDCITTRAFSDLSKMLALTKHLAKEKTIWLAMKGDIDPEEYLSFKNAKCVELAVPHLSEKRALVIVSN